MSVLTFSNNVYIGATPAKAIYKGSTAIYYNMSSLFPSGVSGFYYDFSDQTSLFTDNSGSTPLTLPDTTVGMILDNSHLRILGPELVTNGDFATDTGWSKESWTISNGKATKTSGIAGSIYQSSPAMIQGNTYVITCTVSEYTSGTLTPFCRGTNGGISITANGTYTIRVIAGTDSVYAINFYANSTFAGSIHSISVKSISGSHFRQSNSALRPKWGRAPKTRRNLLSLGGTTLLTNSDGTSTIDNAPTGFTPPIDASFQRVTKLAVSTQFYAYRTSQLGATTGQTVMSCYVMPDAGCTEIGFHTDSTAQGRMRYNIATGVTTKGTNTADAGAISLGGGWYRVWSKTLGTAASITWNMVANTATTGTAASFVVGGHQSESAVLTNFQKTINSLDMTEQGVSSYGYTRPDRADDVLSTTVPANQTGDVAIFGRNGSWIESSKTYTASSTFALGPTTVTGLTAGLLSAVGDIVGLLAIGKTLTDSEKQLVLNYHKSRGAKEWLTSGSEIISNGTFDVDLTGWTNESGTSRGTSSWVSGTVLLSNTGTGNMVFFQVVPTIIGNSYLASFDAVALTGSVTARLFVGTNATNGNNLVLIAPSVPSTNTGIFVATATTTYVSAVAFGGTGPTATFDNISIKPLTAVS